MKKKERTQILKAAMNKLKNDLRQFLNGFKNRSFEFEVNGKVLDATLYNTGINEVLEKITKDKANMLYSTTDIFQNSRYLYSTPDYDGNANVYRWNYFYTPVRIGEDIVGVRIAVRDVVEGQTHLPESQIYNWGIKKDASLGGVQPVNNDSSHGASSDASANSILQTPPDVNTDSEMSTDDTVPSTPSPDDSNKQKLAEVLTAELQTDYDNITNQGGIKNGSENGQPRDYVAGRTERSHQEFSEGTPAKNADRPRIQEANGRGNEDFESVRASAGPEDVTTTNRRYREDQRVVPDERSPLFDVQKAAKEEYNTDCYIVKKTEWDREKPAFCGDGVIYVCETIDADTIRPNLIYRRRNFASVCFVRLSVRIPLPTNCAFSR